MKSLLAGRVSTGEMYFRPHDGSLLFILNATTVQKDRTLTRTLVRVAYQIMMKPLKSSSEEPVRAVPRNGISVCHCFADRSPFPPGFVLISGRPGAKS